MKSHNMLLIALFMAIITSIVTAKEETGIICSKEEMFSRLRENVTENNLTYERILINGTWWIFVFENNRLLDLYVDPDEE